MSPGGGHTHAINLKLHKVLLKNPGPPLFDAFQRQMNDKKRTRFSLRKLLGRPVAGTKSKDAERAPSLSATQNMSSLNPKELTSKRI